MTICFAYFPKTINYSYIITIQKPINYYPERRKVVAF